MTLRKIASFISRIGPTTSNVAGRSSKLYPNSFKSNPTLDYYVPVMVERQGNESLSTAAVSELSWPIQGSRVDRKPFPRTGERLPA
jgi:hypothetical protein